MMMQNEQSSSTERPSTSPRARSRRQAMQAAFPLHSATVSRLVPKLQQKMWTTPTTSPTACVCKHSQLLLPASALADGADRHVASGIVCAAVSAIAVVGRRRQVSERVVSFSTLRTSNLT